MRVTSTTIVNFSKMVNLLLATGTGNVNLFIADGVRWSAEHTGENLRVVVRWKALNPDDNRVHFIRKQADFQVRDEGVGNLVFQWVFKQANRIGVE